MIGQTFTFKSGVKVTLRRVNPVFIGKVRGAVRSAFLDEHGELECPTYDVAVAGGDKETYDHNATTIIEAPYTDDVELQAAWSEYSRLTQELDSELFQRTAKAHMVRGVVEDPPESWIEDQAYWDIELPDDLRDLKFEWLFDQSTGWDELLELILAVQTVRDPIEEAAAAAEDSFHPDLGSGEQDAGADQEEPDEDE